MKYSKYKIYLLTLAILVPGICAFILASKLGPTSIVTHPIGASIFPSTLFFSVDDFQKINREKHIFIVPAPRNGEIISVPTELVVDENGIIEQNKWKQFPTDRTPINVSVFLSPHVARNARMTESKSVTFAGVGSLSQNFDFNYSINFSNASQFYLTPKMLLITANSSQNSGASSNADAQIDWTSSNFSGFPLVIERPNFLTVTADESSMRTILHVTLAKDFIGKMEGYAGNVVTGNIIVYANKRKDKLVDIPVIVSLN